MTPRRYRNTGRPPRDKTIPLGIEWANGKEAKQPYKADQLVWKLDRGDYTIAYFWRLDGQGETESEVAK